MLEAAINNPEPDALDFDVEAKFDFDSQFQRKIGTLILRDSVFADKVKGSVRPEYFTEDAVAAVVGVIQDYQKTYRGIPDKTLLPSVIKDAIDRKIIRDDQRTDVVRFLQESLTADVGGHDYVALKVNDFVKHQAFEQAMIKSLPLLEKRDFAKIAKIMEEAMKAGINDQGSFYDFWGEIDNRTAVRHDELAGRIVKNGITTGYSTLDAYLYHHGWGRKELSCIMGPAKSGKSLSLGDFTKNASMKGFNTAYFSLEVSSQIISNRLDAAIADTAMRELYKDPDEVGRRLKAAQANAGALIMKDFASGTMKPSMLYRAIEDMRKEGIILDLCAVDYADIMAAEYRSDNQIENLRTIYIDLRAIAFEFDLAMLTATQTNRDGAKAVTAKATDVGDDWNKARTVDILIGLNATDEEKKDGEARLYWALSRNTEDGFTLRIKQNREKMQFLTAVLGKE